MEIDPDTVFMGVALAAFLVAGFDVGISFLMRGVRESTPDDRG